MMTSEGNNILTISIVMPLWNNSQEASRAIQGVLRQTHAQFELLIVDDGSTDDSAEVVKSFSDQRIRLFRQTHAGVSAARNRGLSEARHGLIAFCDADDEWCPFFLETIHQLCLKYSKCSIFATSYYYREQDGTVRLPILRGVPGGQWEGILDNYLSVAAKSDPPIWSSAVAVQKSLMNEIGGFPEGIGIGEDLLTWCRLALRGRIAYSSRPCAYFWLRGPLAGIPTRTPELPDKVGKELHRLLKNVPDSQRRAMKRYIAYWHRMRAAMFLQLDNRKEAMHESLTIARYSFLDVQLYVYLILALLPRTIQRALMQGLSWVKIRKRSKAVIL
jgi:glycosyltransferase involved in cell wall biosynthesis